MRLIDHRKAESEDDSGRLFSTAPPDLTHPSLKRRIGERASAALMPLIKRAARPFLGGETIDDALCAVAQLKRDGLAAALSYWDAGHENIPEIEAVNLAAIASMAPLSGESYLSLKPPALRFSRQAARTLASAAARYSLRLHFDSHGAEVTDLQNAMIDDMLGVLGPECLGTTIPGRQQRSLRDAEWAIGNSLNVRVVKGEWPDLADPKRDPRAGFLELIDCLVGRARHVAVATHDLALAREAISRLRAAGTPCEIEVLLGMPFRPLLAWAKANGVSVRVYVPYGRGFIPNAIGVLRRNPRLAFTILAAQLGQCFALFSPRS